MSQRGLTWKAKYYRNKLRNAQLIDMRELYAHWERKQLRELFQYLHVDAVFDVGANVGQYATMLREDVGYDGWIFSFEPIPEVAASAAAAARSDPKRIVHASAIADSSGVQIFNITSDSQFSSLSTPLQSDVENINKHNAVTRSIEVKTETLEVALRRLQARYGFKRPFLKLDTQGFDVQIVEAGQDVIGEFVGLQSELAISKLYDHSVDFREALTRYEAMGFLLSALVPNNAGHFPRLLEIDCIMLRADLA